MTDLTLPDTMADLLELALNDLEACEADPHYHINMGSWLMKTPHACQVCLAGAVIARHVPPEDIEEFLEAGIRLSSPWDLPYGDSVAEKLCALDYIRSGNFHAAFMGFYDTDSCDPRCGIVGKIRKKVGPIAPYAFASEAFKDRLRETVTAFREAGL